MERRAAVINGNEMHFRLPQQRKLLVINSCKQVNRKNTNRIITDQQIARPTSCRYIENKRTKRGVKNKGIFFPFPSIIVPKRRKRPQVQLPLPSAAPQQPLKNNLKNPLFPVCSRNPEAGGPRDTPGCPQRCLSAPVPLAHR